MKAKHITIVGLGLMGASLAGACRKAFPKARITAITRNKKAVSLAKRRRWIHAGTDSYERGLAEAELVIVCTPVETFGRVFDLIDRHAPTGVVVTDVGSVKASVIKEAERKRRRMLFVGAHPMVGSHERGAQYGDPNLYQRGYTFLTRSAKTHAGAYKLVKLFWKRLSARVIELPANQHDRIVSEISHLPHAAALGIMLAVDPKALAFASTGFRDTTRVAMGHPSIWLSIFLENHKAVAASLKSFEAKISEIRRAISRKEGAKIEKMLKNGASRRREI